MKKNYENIEHLERIHNTLNLQKQDREINNKTYKTYRNLLINSRMEYLGYLEVTKGFRFTDENEKIIISRNVIFFETKKLNEKSEEDNPAETCIEDIYEILKSVIDTADTSVDTFNVENMSIDVDNNHSEILESRNQS